jgi:hypothetical protein
MSEVIKKRQTDSSSFKMRLVPLDRELEHHELLVETGLKSLKRIKNKLGKYQLSCYLAPITGSAREIKEWENKASKILEEKRPIPTPTLREYTLEYKRKNPHPIMLSTGEVIKSKETKEEQRKEKEARKLRDKTLAYLKESRQLKNFSKAHSFGVLPRDEVLRTIENYNGCNTFFKSSRTLVRKHGYSRMFEESSLPSWIDAISYSQKPSRTTATDKSYQLSFLSTSREHVKASEIKEKLIQLRSIQSTSGDGGSVHGDESIFSVLSRPSSCERPHSKREYLPEPNAVSISSPLSTIGRVMPVNRMKSPTDVRIKPLEGAIALSDSSTIDEDTVSLAKSFDVQRGKYHFDETGSIVKSLVKDLTMKHPNIHDFTQGALKLQNSQESSPEGLGNAKLAMNDLDLELEVDSGLAIAVAAASAMTISDDSSAKTSSSSTRKSGDGDRGGGKKGKRDLKSEKALKKAAEQKAASIIPDDVTDIGRFLRKWRKDNVYSPGKPRYREYLKQLVPINEVNLSSLLLPGPGVDVDGDADEIYSKYFEEEKERYSVDIKETNANANANVHANVSD